MRLQNDTLSASMRLLWLLMAASLMAGLGCSDNKEETPARECAEDWQLVFQVTK